MSVHSSRLAVVVAAAAGAAMATIADPAFAAPTTLYGPSQGFGGVEVCVGPGICRELRGITELTVSYETVSPAGTAPNVTGSTDIPGCASSVEQAFFANTSAANGGSAIVKATYYHADRNGDRTGVQRAIQAVVALPGTGPATTVRLASICGNAVS